MMRELKKQETEQKNEHKHVIITQQDKYKLPKKIITTNQLKKK